MQSACKKHVMLNVFCKSYGDIQGGHGKHASLAFIKFL